jgi:diacylglycerol kinase (ATP)
LLARDLRHGEHGAWREVRTIRARSFEVSTCRPRPVNTDGEIVTQTPARFSLRPAAVAVFVPERE